MCFFKPSLFSNWNEYHETKFKILIFNTSIESMGEELKAKLKIVSIIEVIVKTVSATRNMASCRSEHSFLTK